MDRLSIHFLNHSSVLLEGRGHRLVVDPWLVGSAFSGGWALEWQNPAALDLAATADAVWISHPHSDHMHAETLKLLCARNPGLTMLANSNSQVDLAAILKPFPFGRIVPLPERTPIEVGPETSVFVIPSLAIDSILAYAHRGFFVLNVNDAILAPNAVRSILNRCPLFKDRGPDALLINFSHANRVAPSKVEQVTRYYKDRLHSSVEVFRPRACLPIASFHLYTGELARWQNATRVVPEDLLAIDPCVRKFLPGYRADLTASTVEVVEREIDAAILVERSYDAPPAMEVLRDAFSTYCERMRKELFGVLLPRSLSLRLSDLAETVVLDFKDGSMRPTSASPDLECRAKPFHVMLTKPFGFDGFYVGADYRVGDGPRSEALVADFIFKGCLVDYQMTPKAIVASVPRRDRWEFLLNRREQVLDLLSKGHAFGGVR